MSSPLFSLAWKSLMARRATAVLTLIAVALSVALYVGVERMRTAAHDSFLSTVSGVDAIVGGRTGPINLLLFSIFRLGDATTPVSWESYEAIAARPDVSWAVPISLGDSHKGYRVLGTTPEYFTHFGYGERQQLELTQGQVFDPHGLETVLGAEVARKLDYKLGDEIVLSHGLGEVSFLNHDAFKFRVTGILAPTGTPVDQTVHIGLEGLEVMHAPPDLDDQNDTHADEHSDEHADHHDADEHFDDGGAAEHDDHAAHDDHDHAEPGSVTAVLVGVVSPPAALRFRYEVNAYRQEPLLAILPGETLQQLWSVVGSAEQTLRAISLFVIVVGLATILIATLTSLNERRREMAILRAVGARAQHVFSLIMMESVIIALAGAIAGVVVIHILLAIAAPIIQARYGLALHTANLGLAEAIALIGVPLAAGLMSVWPAARALKNALADGLTIRI